MNLVHGGVAREEAALRKVPIRQPSFGVENKIPDQRSVFYRGVVIHRIDRHNPHVYEPLCPGRWRHGGRSFYALALIPAVPGFVCREMIVML